MKAPDIIPDNDENPSELERQLTNTVQGVTGLLKKPVENTVSALSMVIQNGLQHRLLNGFKDAWDFLVKEGQVNPDYLNTVHGMATFRELLKALESEEIDEKRFEAVQTIFLKAARKEPSDKEAILIIQLMKIANTLSTGEILLLHASYKLHLEAMQGKNIEYDSSAYSWLTLMASKSDLQFMTLVEIEEEKLMSKRLLSNRSMNDKSAVAKDNNYRLTDAARRLCEYMYESPVEASSKSAA